MKEEVVQDIQASEQESLPQEPPVADIHIPELAVSPVSPPQTQGWGVYAARLQEVLETVLILVGLLVMFELLPHQVLGIDAQIRFQAILDLINHGTLSHMKYSIVGPGFSVPLVLLGKVYQTPLWWAERYNLVVFAVGLGLTYWMLKDRVERWSTGLLRKFFLLLIVASMFPNHVSNYYGEVFTAMGVGVGVLAVTLGPSLAGWSAIVLGVVNTPATLLGLGFMVLKRIFDNKRLRYVLVIVAVVALILAEGWIRRGNPFKSGYEGEYSISTSFFFGLISILFSFGKGLLFFAPGLLLPLKSSLVKVKQGLQLYQAYLLWMCFLAGMVLFYSVWWAWYGGWFWGPRFFLFASIPASFALAVRLHYRDGSLGVNLLTFIVLCLSVWVGIDGAIFDQKTLADVCVSHNYAMEFLCHFVPQYSVLWRPFAIQEFAHLKPSEIAYITTSLIIFAYLAIPLLAKMGKQTWAIVVHPDRAYLNFKTWHF